VKNRPAMKDWEYFTAVEQFAAALGANPGIFADIK
jgi:hypothetical protein